MSSLKKYVENKIPKVDIAAMKRYIEEGIPMNKFLTAVFSNDLYGAFQQCTENQTEMLDLYVYYSVKFAPEESRGSYGKVSNWIKKEGKKNENIDTNANASDIW